MNILISGSHGLVGTALLTSLEEEGHQVARLGRDFARPIAFEGIDAVIHLAGESIAEGRWNAAKKERIERSRVDGTTELSRLIAESSHKPRVFISASAIGYYGDRSDEKLSEKSEPGSGFLPAVCAKWEAATRPAEEAGVRVVKLRTGIVLSTQGGALNKMLFPFKMGGGGVLGSGQQYMSWISLDDMIGAIRFLLFDSSLEGPVNLVAPNAVTNHEFTKTLGKALGRPTVMPMPAFAARLLFGEMADALLLSSARVVPEKLSEAGYAFTHRDLQSALEDILE